MNSFAIKENSLLRSRSVRVAILLIVLLGIFYHINSQYKLQTSIRLQENIPPQGLALNDTKGLIPGNPQNAIDDLKRVYKCIMLFKSRHGRLPRETLVLAWDMNKHLKEYGLNSEVDTDEILTTPDSQYSDSPLERQYSTMPNGRYYTYAITDKRPDGSLITSPKPKGTKDVLAFTKLYYHENIRHYTQGRSTSNPVGFYLVLWDDGQVEKIPYDKLIFVPHGTTSDGTNNFGIVFPHQAGIASNALTYDQFYQTLGDKKGPRGKAGAKGLNYKGKALP